MEHIEATYRVVTPLFMSGTDQTKAELRLPSIKGALRFWWRALAWERLSNLEEIRKEENELFGGTDTGQAKVLLNPNKHEITTGTQNKWHPNQWEAYVGYGLVETTGGIRRDFIKPGSQFNLQLASRERLSNDELNVLRNTLLAFGLLGGLGGRSRKGWGSVNLLELNGALTWSAPRSRNELEHEIENLLSNKEGKPEYTAFSRATRVEFGETQKNAVAAHRFLAESYKETIREGYDKREREQFGLPRKGNQQRRASPVFLHIHEFSDGQAVPVAAFLPAQFLEKQQEPAGGSEKIKSFLDKVAGNPQ